MSSSIVSSLFTTDKLTYLLGLTAAVTFLLGNYLVPVPLVHPILLGRQSDVERVRKSGESAICRNFGTQMTGRLPARPANGVNTTSDFIKSDYTASRSLWSIKLTNAELMKRVAALANGLVNVAGIHPKEDNVLLLLNDGIEFLIADLALASQSIPSITLSSLTLLSAVLDSHPPNAIILHIHLLGHILEQIAENSEYAHHTLILVGEGDLPTVVDKLPVKIVWLADLERQGAKLASGQVVAPEPSDIFTLSCYPGTNNELRATEVTHQNMTAGVAATRALFPLNGAITPSDSIMSSHTLSSPLGRAIAYTALYEGAHFRTVKSTEIFRKREDLRDEDGYPKQIHAMTPTPTLLFLTPSQLNDITSAILASAQTSIFFPLSWRHKLFHLQNGFLSKDSFWDTNIFLGARRQVLKDVAGSLRAVIVSGAAVEAKALTPSRIALSIPVVNAHEHPLVVGPVFFSHPLDFQDFGELPGGAESQLSTIAHVGPPSINIEVKLLGVDDAAVEAGAVSVGELAVRGPSVTTPHDDNAKAAQNWVLLGERGLLQANGSFKVVPAIKYHI